MAKKQELNSEMLYRQNKKRAKIFMILSPIALYLFLALTLMCFILAVKNSVGNVIEILDALDKKKYGTEEITAHYQALIARWGEWEIIGENSAGLVIRYVNIGNALFSGLMRIYTTLTLVSFSIAIVFGKIVFPALHKMYQNNNDEMVDLATLKSAGQIDELTHKAKLTEKEWF